MPGQHYQEEMEAWVDEHGSTRLKKAKEAGLLNDCVGVYRAERLAMERPQWQYLDLEQMSSSDRRRKLLDPHNPSEAALDAYLDARQRYGEEVFPVSLQRWRQGDDEVAEILTQAFLGRIVGINVKCYNSLLAQEAEKAGVPA